MTDLLKDTIDQLATPVQTELPQETGVGLVGGLQPSDGSIPPTPVIPGPPSFSIVLIAKDEAKSLPNLLKSLEEFKARGGETLLVDTGSTDDTVKIAEDWGVIVEKVGPKFIHKLDALKAKEINDTFIVRGEEPIVVEGDSYFDFGEARAYAMMKAKNDYVCCPGCDEVFTTLNLDKVEEYIAKGYTQMRVDYIWSRTSDGQPDRRFYRDAYLFNRKKWHWVGCIHETVVENVAPEKWIELPTNVVLVNHYQIHQASRTNRDLVGLAISCLNEPDNDRHAHYFARELMFKKRYRSAVQQFMRHADLNKWDLERGQSLTFIGDCYQYLKQEGRAIDWYNESIKFCAARREPLIRLALIYYNKRDFQRTAIYAQAVLTIPYIPFYANQLDHYRHLPHELLYWALYYLGDKEGAKYHWSKCMEYMPTNEKFLSDKKFFVPEEK